MSAPEFSHRVAVEKVARTGTPLLLVAGEDARARLAARFGLLSLESLSADLLLTRDARGVALSGMLAAEAVQSCVVSLEPVPVRVEERLALRFEVPAPPEPDAEVELSAEALDVLPIEGGEIDVGEAVAQSLGLALDPYPRAAPEVLAEARRRLMSEEEAAAMARAAGPFARLAKG